MRLDAVGQHEVDRAAEEIYPGASAATVNRQVYAVVAAVLHYAAADRLCEYRKISKRREAKPKPRDMPMGDLRALIEAADEPALRRLLIVLVFQGWRIAETLARPWEQYELSRGRVNLYGSRRRRPGRRSPCTRP